MKSILRFVLRVVAGTIGLAVLFTPGMLIGRWLMGPNELLSDVNAPLLVRYGDFYMWLFVGTFVIVVLVILSYSLWSVGNYLVWLVGSFLTRDKR